MTRLVRSAVLAAPAGEVWRLLRDFGGVHRWHSGLAPVVPVPESSPGVGAARTLTLDHVELHEQLLSLSDREMSCSWCLIGATAPVPGYVASFRLRRVTEGDRSLLEWRMQFEAPAGQRAAIANLLGTGLVEVGLDALVVHFASAPSRILEPAAGRDQSHSRPGLALPTGSGAPKNGLVSSPSVAAASRARAALAGECIVVARFGGPEVLSVVPVSVPPPQSGEVRIRHAAVGVNMIDVHGRAGHFGLEDLPAVPGMEAAGVVLDCGAGVSHLAPGDRVVYACRPPGAYASIRTMSADFVVPLPDGIDDQPAAGVFLKGITADLLVHDVHPVRHGELVLVHAAAGGLGLLLCGWARALGATVIGVVSRAEKSGAALEAGCRAVIVSSREDVVQAVRDLTGGRGVDVVFDGIGRATFDVSVAALARRGHLVSFGQASGPLGPRDLDGLLGRRLSRPTFTDFTADPAELRTRAGRLFTAIESGEIPVRIDSRWPLARAADAHRRLESRESVGAILLLPEAPASVAG